MPNVITSAVFLLIENKNIGKYIYANFTDKHEIYRRILPKAYENFVSIVKGKTLLMDENTYNNFPKNVLAANLFYISKQNYNSTDQSFAVENLSKGINLAKKKALELNQNHIYIIGNSQLLNQSLKKNFLDEIQLTLVYNLYEKFSETIYFDLNQWKIVEDSGVFTSESYQFKDLRYRYLKLNSKYKLNEF